MSFSRSPNKGGYANPALPLIGVPARIQAENAWRSSYTGKDECNLEDIEKQRDKIKGYNSYAIFDSKNSELNGLSVRDGHVVYIIGESRTANPFQFGTMWIIEFEDGYVCCAYHDELFPLKDNDFVDHFGKSLIFDARGMIYAIAERARKRGYLSDELNKYIEKELNSFLDDKKKSLHAAVIKTIEFKDDEAKLEILKENILVPHQEHHDDKEEVESENKVEETVIEEKKPEKTKTVTKKPSTRKSVDDEKKTIKIKELIIDEEDKPVEKKKDHDTEVVDISKEKPVSKSKKKSSKSSKEDKEDNKKDTAISDDNKEAVETSDDTEKDVDKK